MKNLKFLTVFAFLIIGSLTLSAQELGVVNVEDVLNSLPAKKSADAELENLVAKHQTEIKKQQDALAAIEKDVQSKTQGKSDAEIQAMMTQLEAQQKDYMTKQQALVTYQQAASKEIGEKEATLLKPIEDSIKNAINKVAATKGLKYVIEKSVLLYANGAEITADVKKELGIK
ncbi:MAG: OmpH family outer membrane protein [Moheibacter sp.]